MTITYNNYSPIRIYSHAKRFSLSVYRVWENFHAGSFSKRIALSQTPARIRLESGSDACKTGELSQIVGADRAMKPASPVVSTTINADNVCAGYIAIRSRHATFYTHSGEYIISEAIVTNDVPLVNDLSIRGDKSVAGDVNAQWANRASRKLPGRRGENSQRRRRNARDRIWERFICTRELSGFRARTCAKGTSFSPIHSCPPRSIRQRDSLDLISTERRETDSLRNRALDPNAAKYTARFR